MSDRLPRKIGEALPAVMPPQAAAMMDGGRQAAILSAMDDLKAIRTFVASEMRDKLDYGIVPGTAKKSLFLPGAQKIAMFYNTSPEHHYERIELGDGHLECVVTTRLVNRASGTIVSSGLGSCSTMEKKYRWRGNSLICPTCGKDTIRKSRDKPEYYCWRKIEGCGATFKLNHPEIAKQGDGSPVENPDIHDVRNTVLKMACKRCLGGNTPLLILTTKGPIRTTIQGLWNMRTKSPNGSFWVPSIDGGWRSVSAMSREEHDCVYRIDLRDGSYVHASGNHRFPTARGLLSVNELRVEDFLIRSPLPTNTEDHARTEYGWAAGLYLAEGSEIHEGRSVRFTLHKLEAKFAERLAKLAEPLGANVTMSPRKVGEILDVNIYGYAFAGLMSQFVQGKTCRGKHVSRFALRQSKAFIRAMLDGYLDGDGHLCERPGRNPEWRLGFTGDNRELASDLRCLCSMLGLRISLHRSVSKSEGREYPTYLGWIKEPVESYNQKDMAEVVSIVRENRRAVLYDIEVDGDHLFCLANGIQTHNSLVSAAMSLGCMSELFTQDIEDIYDLAQYEATVVEMATEPVKPQNDSGHATGQYASPEQIKAFRDATLEFCTDANARWADEWTVAGGTPGDIHDVLHPTQMTRHLLKWAIATGRLAPVGMTLDPDSGKPTEKVSVEQAKGYVAIVYAREPEAIQEEAEAYFRKQADLAREDWRKKHAADEEDIYASEGGGAN